MTDSLRDQQQSLFTGSRVFDPANLRTADPLELSSHFVDEFLKADAEFPEPFTYLDFGHTVRYLPTNRRKSDKSEPWFYYSPFSLIDVLNIPDEIFDQYNNTSVSTKMGLFPEIGRAWIAVDSRLYFWNYTAGQNNDFQAFEELNEVITVVKLAKPKQGTFISSLNYMLVIATTEDIYLVALSYTKDKPMELYDTGMSVSTSGMQVDQLSTDDTNGRIFFTSKSSGTDIWEVTYNPHETWFSSKCSKVCRTRSGVISNLLPTLPKLPIPSLFQAEKNHMLNGMNSPEVVTQLCVDETRSLIYTLTSRSGIRVYAMVNGKDDIRELGHISLARIRSEVKASRYSPTDNVFGLEEGENLMASTSKLLAEPFTIVSIEPIKAYQSRAVYFAAITSNGTRVFYRATAPEARAGFSSTLNLQCFHVRPGPKLVNDMVPGGSSKTQSRIIEPHYFFSVTENETSSSGDRVLACALDTAYLLSTAHGDYEVYSMLEVEGYVRAIESISWPKFSAASTPLGYANETAAQYTVRPPEIAIMTNSGIFVFQRKFPSMIFEQQLPDMQHFYELYGTTETCSEALAFVCKPSFASEALRSQVAANYISIGGKPAYSTQQKYQSKLLFQPSGCCQGLATYLARIVRQTWDQPVFKSTKVGQETRFSLDATKGQLEVLQGRLIDLWQFFETYKAHIDGLEDVVQRPQETLDDESLFQMEHRSMSSLLKLVRNMREGAGFLLLLVEETMPLSDGIEAALGHLNIETRKKIQSLTFKAFFASNDGKNLAKELVTSLVNLNLARSGSVATITSVLQERCENYCSPNDVILYKASEFLRRAKTASHDLDICMHNLYESLAMFKTAAASLTEEGLKETISEYVEMKFFQGAVDVALQVASHIDGANTCFGYIMADFPKDDVRAPIFEELRHVYQMIFSVLETADQEAENSGKNMLLSARDEAYKICFMSRSETFHYCFYDWFVEKHLEGRLLDIQTPYILPYLINKASKEFYYADMLWIYCQKRGDFFQAAMELFKLATSDFKLTLEERIEYLSRARTYCSSDTEPSLRQPMADLATQIEEFFSVASVQDELLSALANDQSLEASVKEESIDRLNGKILTISELFNDFAKVLGYYDICLAVFKVSDYRDSMEIISTWRSLLAKTHSEASNKDEAYKDVSAVVQRLGQQFLLSEFVFPLDFLVNYLEKYRYEKAPNSPKGWIIETFLNAGVACETLYVQLMDLTERREHPFDISDAYELLVGDVIYLLNRWTSDAKSRHVVQHVTEKDLQKLRKVDPKGIESLIRRLNLV